MRADEFESAINAMTDAEFAAFVEEFGGGQTREHYIRTFPVVASEWEARICSILKKPTEQERLNKAQLSAADAAIESANHAREANAHSIESNRIAVEANQLAHVANTTADKANQIATTAMTSAQEAKKKSNSSTVTAWIAIAISLAKFAYDVISAYGKGN